MAAIASLQAGALANNALLLKNESVLFQAKASDQWAFYQAKGIKGIIYQVQAGSLTGRAALSQQYLAEAKRYRDEQADLKAQAEEMESKVKDNGEAAEHFLHHHHQFALAVTLYQISIALSAIASLTRRKGMWYFGMAIAVVGLVFFIRGWL
jgi:hypothetical protein